MTSMNLVKKKIIISMVAIILLVITIIGIAYAYFSTSVTGNKTKKSVELSAGMLELTYDGDNSYVELIGLKPNQKIENKTFKIKNTGKNDIESYDVILEDVINELKYYEDLTYTLKCESNIGTCNGSEGIFPLYDAVIATNEMKKNEIHSYILSVNYIDTNKDQSDDMNKNIIAKVNIKDDHYEFEKLNIYGNTLVTLNNEKEEVSLVNKANIISLGTKLSNKLSKNNDKYKINITAISKNLFNINEINKDTIEVLEDGLNVKILSTNTSTSLGKTLKELCPEMKAGEEYILSYNSKYKPNISLGTYNKDNIWENNTSKVITEEDLNSIVRIGEEEYTAMERIISIKDIQVEKGSSVTYYIPYSKTTTKSLYINEPLRCINEVCDYIDLINKRVYRNVGKEVYKGEENFSKTTGTYWHQENVTTAFTYPVPTNALANSYGMPVISNMLSFDSTNDGINKNKPYISGNSTQIVINLTNDIATNVTELQEYLKNNNLEYIYQLSETNSDELITFSDLYYLKEKNITVCDDNNLCASNIEVEYKK